MSDKLLAINSGSSSLKYKLFDMPSEHLILSGAYERLGNPNAAFRMNFKNFRASGALAVTSHEKAVDHLLNLLLNLHVVHSLDEIRGVGHRIAHGGEIFKHPVRVDQYVLQTIDRLSDLAPMHNPVNAAGIRLFSEALPQAIQVAVFDTSFHQTMPAENYMYPIPYEYYEKYKIRKYGFHGTSHEYVAQEAAKILGRKITELKIITCHLGNGSSICCIDRGKSIDTSMGFTPTAGLMMGTRSGDIDPTILTYLQRKLHLTVDETEEVINRKSGIMGVSGVSNDFRDVLAYANKGDKRSILAIEMFTRRICSFIERYKSELGKLDALVFTAGIGEHSPFLRKKVCDKLKGLHIYLDLEKNEQNGPMIQSEASEPAVLVIPTDEELVIARETFHLLREAESPVIMTDQPVRNNLQVSSSLKERMIKADKCKRFLIKNTYNSSLQDENEGNQAGGTEYHQ
ncbi:acetate/propionate family kinase [Sporolactobacillus sp. THM19-2]|jgi:acetate kinase|uniref:acetate/propionate family kinase n=1 Tax=Sporolactobacillus sp. THM19-2 TaxID=2511171 RepID=UPI001022288A|nr:acetate kinase [Sporolactobacillus sp. THM19-2]RYL90973.1 acetate kinase [Sporolactobacillus sp. THM19-2]